MKLFFILGNQLFPSKYLDRFKKDHLFFMAEDYQLCTYEKHHKQKILLFLSSMRSHADSLKSDKFNFKLASFYLNKDEIWQNKGENLFMGIVSISNIIFDKTGSYGIFTATYGCGKLCGHCTRFYLKKVNGIWEIIQTKVYCVS